MGEETSEPECASPRRATRALFKLVLYPPQASNIQRLRRLSAIWPIRRKLAPGREPIWAQSLILVPTLKSDSPSHKCRRSVHTALFGLIRQTDGLARQSNLTTAGPFGSGTWLQTRRLKADFPLFYAPIRNDTMHLTLPRLSPQPGRCGTIAGLRVTHLFRGFD